jgi:hypothetical protein
LQRCQPVGELRVECWDGERVMEVVVDRGQVLGRRGDLGHRLARLFRERYACGLPSTAICIAFGVCEAAKNRSVGTSTDGRIGPVSLPEIVRETVPVSRSTVMVILAGRAASHPVARMPAVPVVRLVAGKAQGSGAREAYPPERP